MPIGLRVISCLNGSVVSGRFLGGRTPNPGCHWRLATGSRSSGSSTWSKFKTPEGMSHKVVGERSRGTRRVVARSRGARRRTLREFVLCHQPSIAMRFAGPMLVQIAVASVFNATEGFDSNPGAEFAQTLVRNRSNSVLKFIAALTFFRVRLPSPLRNHLEPRIITDSLAC